jgi:oligoendopeptidase F
MTYLQSSWSLKDLFSSLNSADLEEAFTDLEQKMAEFEKLRPQLKADLPASSFIEIMQESEEITRLIHKLDAFVYLAFAADTQSQPAQTLLARFQQFLAGLENRSLFFSLWWKNLDDASARRLMEAAGDTRYYLQVLRNYKPHTLGEAEEKVINLKNVTGASALVTLYDAITNRYVFKVEMAGETKTMSRDELSVHFRSADAGLRARAYQEMYRIFGAEASILGQMYQTRARDWCNENLTLRKFSTPLAVRNLRNDIPDDAVETLLKVCRENASVFRRFFRLKARLLGMEKLRRYDIYAPVATSVKVYPFDQAVEMVMDSFSSFQPEFGSLARRVIEENHIDSEIRKGKQSGAFCSYPVPGITPWVNINYQGRAEDVATLAHELGHAIHGMLAASHSVFTFDACLPLAETASTFGEMMLVERLLSSETDQAVRRDLLFRQMDEFYASIMRQAYFAIFEQQAYEMVLKNASVDEIAAAYIENLREQFGEAVKLGDEFKWEWVSIPHFFYSPFYVYAYAFGQLLVLSLYQQYKAEGEAFKPRYIKLLSAGGSQAPVQVCAEAGIDIHSTAFWQGGFDVINRLVEQLEQIG